MVHSCKAYVFTALVTLQSAILKHCLQACIVPV